MTTSPRVHSRPPDRIPAPSVAAGDQDIDDYADDPERSTIQSAPETTTTADGTDRGRETGELYGQGIAPTGDIDEEGVRGIQDYTDEGGQTWLEALETSAAENGPAGQAPIDDVRGTDAEDEPSLPDGADDDDDDEPPVADRGSGGPAGL